MTIRQWTVTGALGLLMLLAAKTGRAQEPVRPGGKPPAGVEGSAGIRDMKALGDPKAAAAAALLLESAYLGDRPPEAARMLIAILRGSQMGPGDGWFGPADSRYSWKWLANYCGVDPAKGGIPRKSFRGPENCFARLDRNKDGVITPDELDWSERNPYVQMSYMANRLFRKLNAEGNARLTKDELLQFFEKASQGKDYVSSDDFRDALLAGMSGGFQPGDAPSPPVLIRGLFAGEIGSMNEGPKLNEPAPHFTLKTVDGRDTVQLAKLLGSKPVVLVFGNFTCGPFRSFYPDVETVYERYKKDAHFLMVYVREAHPTDGWKMESNSRVGVAVKQPTVFDDRVAVAGQFCKRLKATMPVVVDEINDPVGHAYSGMPARLYVIDGQGKVAYKSGRGPFGFRVGEMEQALVMALLEQQKLAGPAPASTIGEAGK
jgi:thiol-disulfide isomerase/thioredoxin